MLVTSPPGWLLPSHRPGQAPVWFWQTFPCPVSPRGCPRTSSRLGWLGGLGKVPTGTSSRLFCRLYSGVLIIPAPGGIVPHYYTVDLYLIRHHPKPSAPSWHPCLPRIPHISVCFITPAETKLQFQDGIKEKLLNFHPATPGECGAPRGG